MKDNLIITAILIVIITTTYPPQTTTSLGMSSTIAITYTSTYPTVCSIIARHPHQSIQCYTKQNNQTVPIQPNTSFDSISGGHNFFCGLHSGGLILHCWNTTNFQAKRIYYNHTNNRLTDLTVGKSQICAVEAKTDVALCWRFPSPEKKWKFNTITSGGGFSCGILQNNSRVKCWGRTDISAEMQTLFGNLTMLNLVAGESHACGLTRNGILICRGRNESGQLDVPFHSPFEFESTLALGLNHSCGIRRRNGIVVCWGGGTGRSQFNSDVIKNISFESIVAGLDFTCGLTTRNLSIICWGPGWNHNNQNNNNTNPGNVIPFGIVIPGPCVNTPCTICGVYPDSDSLCGGSGTICRSCEVELPVPALWPPIPAPLPPREKKSILLFIYCIVGSVGAFAGICTILYFLRRACGFSSMKSCDTIQPGNALPSRSSSIKQNSSGSLTQQRSGTSSKCAERAEEFSFSEIASATNNFLPENKIGGGSFGTVYKGTLFDGREVAIKRGDNTNMRAKKFQEKESAFVSELALLCRLHHKHLVRLVGFCQENNEWILVYEYMSNGSLHNLLHKSSEVLNSWRMRLKIALDAARGIEYLHSYAVPPIIHRDIKSSNILLDSSWTARVSDFGLSLMDSDPDQESVSTKAVGTVGYIDPEYFVLNILTPKSDIYGFGVVLFELLTGKKAVFKDDESRPTGLVEFVRSRVSCGDEIRSILDERVELSETNVEAVKLVAYTALRCVSLEGKERPDMSEIVANLETALAVCESSHGIICDTTFGFASK